MSNRYYIKGEARASHVRQLFGSIATRYDLLNDIQSIGVHRLWKRRLVHLSGVQPGDRALDVCCGTGDITIRLAHQGAKVVGLDFSEPMLQIARQRAAHFPRATSVKFIQGNALELPFDNDSFSAVTVGYGLRNLSDWESGLREMVRVVRPGGRVLVLDFGKPENGLLRTLNFGYLRMMVPFLGLLFCGNASAYAYILESLREYPAQRGVADWMRKSGLNEVMIHNLLGGVMSINSGVKVVAKDQTH